MNRKPSQQDILIQKSKLYTLEIAHEITLGGPVGAVIFLAHDQKKRVWFNSQAGEISNHVGRGRIEM